MARNARHAVSHDSIVRLGCSAGVEVTLCTIEGEGHCWPGQTLCPFGASTTDISANDEMWKVFERFQLP